MRTKRLPHPRATRPPATQPRSEVVRDRGLRANPGRLLLNYLRTGVLLAALTALAGGLGYVLGGPEWMLVAVVIVGLLNLVALWTSDRAVLRMYGAKEVDPGRAPWLHDTTAALAHRAQLPMPRLFVIEDDAPNAFATGRSPTNAAVAVTTGLMDHLDDDEVAGVIAHELAHIKNRDTLTMTVAGTIAGGIGLVSQLAGLSWMLGGDREDRGGWIAGLVMIVLAPLMATLVQMAISRGREYEADRVGALIAGSPDGLADALLALERGQEVSPTDPVPGTQHLFIIQQLDGGGLATLFSTHPPIRERVRRLRAVGLASGQAR